MKTRKQKWVTLASAVLVACALAVLGPPTEHADAAVAIASDATLDIDSITSLELENLNGSWSVVRIAGSFTTTLEGVGVFFEGEDYFIEYVFHADVEEERQVANKLYARSRELVLKPSKFGLQMKCSVVELQTPGGPATTNAVRCIANTGQRTHLIVTP